MRQDFTGNGCSGRIFCQNDHGGKPYSAEEVYKDSSLVKYRNIIMCPSHLVEKWKEAIQTDIPYAKVVIIKSIKELCRLRKQGKAENRKGILYTE